MGGDVSAREILGEGSITGFSSGPELDDRDLLPGVQPIGLDGHRHVVGIEPHRHVGAAMKVTSPVVVSTDQPETCRAPSR